MTQLGFVLDLDRCTGCAACIIACTNENSPTGGIAWRSITTFNRQRLPEAPVFHYSLACNHCLDPACLAGCPASAYTKDRVTGAVLIYRDRCIGCRYCAWVCPYGAPQFDPAGGLMEKCTFCEHRLADGLKPACVVACPVDALGFEEVETPAAVARRGFPETGLRPAVRVVGERRLQPPEMTAAPQPVAATQRCRPNDWRSFTAESSLWAFTSVITFLTAWFTAATALGGEVILPVFAAAAGLAMGVSALHLGRPARAWRGILNWRRSWISREAVLVTMFLVAACVGTAASGTHPVALWAVSAVGFAGLFAMDLVYRVPGQKVQPVPHSAMATLTAAFYVGLLLEAPALALPAAAVKLALSILRGERFSIRWTPLAVVRVGVGLVLPCCLLFVGGLSPWLLVAPAVLGELIDRAEFYAGLEFLTPEIQIDRDLAETTQSSSSLMVG